MGKFLVHENGDTKDLMEKEYGAAVIQLGLQAKRLLKHVARAKVQHTGARRVRFSHIVRTRQILRPKRPPSPQHPRWMLVRVRLPLSRLKERTDRKRESRAAAQESKG